MQALLHVYKDASRVMPQLNNERKQEIQEQLAVLFQVAEQCTTF